MNNRSRTIKYIIRIVIVLVVTALILVFAARIKPDPSEQTAFKMRYDLTLWYYDESLTPYLTSFGDDYFKVSGKRVQVELVPSLEFFENINKRNIEGNDAPDLYVIDSSKLENAYLSSLAKINSNPLYSEEHFSKHALSCAVYKDRLVGYPLGFNIAFFAYNTEMNGKAPASFDDVLALLPEKEDETEAASQESPIKEAAIEFTGEYEDPDGGIAYEPPETKKEENEEVSTAPLETTASYDVTAEKTLEFDVSNLLYSYFFIGDHIDLGGANGDDANSFDLSSDQYTQALQYMQTLSERSGINPNLVDYNMIEKNFMQGKTSMALFSVTSLTKLYGSGIPFSICAIPPLNAEMNSKPVSQTSVICVNPDSDHVNQAEDLAQFLSYDHANKLFDTCGLLSARIPDSSEKNMDLLRSEYERSASLPKLIETENIWENLSTMLTSVWQGEDIERAKSKLNVAVYVALSTRTEQEDK